VFGGIIRDAIHDLKYKRNVALGDTFSEYLTGVLRQTDWECDIIAPVPLGIARFRERGYNQSALLARPTAYKYGIKYMPDIIKRTRETKTQIDLSFDERQVNVAGAFQSEPDTVNGKGVIIVDDVMTSGSTLLSCADALFQAGASRVYGLTLARVSYED
jgi:ComF family protein